MKTSICILKPEIKLKSKDNPCTKITIKTYGSLIKTECACSTHPRMHIGIINGLHRQCTNTITYNQESFLRREDGNA